MKRSIVHGKEESQIKKRKVIFDSKLIRGSSSEKKKKTSSLNRRVLISQTLNLLNEKEQSRFEAFTRCTFSGNAVSNFIAACLIHSKDQSEFRRVHNLHLIGGSGRISVGQIGVNSHGAPGSNDVGMSSSIDNSSVISNRIDETIPITISNTYTKNKNHHNNTTTPPLSDLVAPGAASKITSVVTTLAKIHAQRLVQSARSIASAQGYNTNEKLQIHHLMEAHQARTKQHARSGFFMQSKSRSQFQSDHNNSSIDGNFSAAFGRVDKNRLQYEAALQAQEIYDKIMNDYNGKEHDDDGSIKSMETKDNDGKNDNEIRMDTSDDDGKKEEGNKDCVDDKGDKKEKEDDQNVATGETIQFVK